MGKIHVNKQEIHVYNSNPRTFIMKCALVVKPPCCSSETVVKRQLKRLTPAIICTEDTLYSL